GLDNDCSDGDETDVDGDGHDWEGMNDGDDCDDEDPDIYPGADEVQNGVDDDCDGNVDEAPYPCPNHEHEPNDSWLQTDSISTNDQICGLIDTAGDMDWYSFGVTSWTQVDFELIGQADGSQISAVLALWSDDGVTLLAEDIGGDADMAGIFPYNGTFYVSVNDQNPANAGWGSYYTLNTYASSPCDSIEIESNDEYGLADYMVAWGTHCGESTHCDIFGCDDDYWAFDVYAGETWTFDVDALDVGSLLAAELRLFDTDGTTELTTDENMPLLIDPEITWTFGNTGTYYIQVSADWYYLNSLGPYMMYVY
ncbi:MAG: MopE-related protein, partial [Myxococcota bacterium]|nr:MopE-related protein [Myxococcota bacterium]